MFKYAPFRYSASLAIMGCLRVGTLYDFRRNEHRRGISDPTEGKKRVSHHISSLRIADSNDPSLQHSKDFRALKAFRAIDIKDSRNVTIEDISVSQAFEARDCYIYCLSKRLSPSLYREFEGTDSCVEVLDPHEFFANVTESLNCITRVEFQGIHEVTYTTRAQEWNGVDWGTHPALIKEPEFHAQAELRAVWTPRIDHTIEPVVLGNSSLPGCCRLVQRLGGRGVA